jgi:hypothetical protein
MNRKNYKFDHITPMPADIDDAIDDFIVDLIDKRIEDITTKCSPPAPTTTSKPAARPQPESAPAAAANMPESLRPAAPAVASGNDLVFISSAYEGSVDACPTSLSYDYKF